MDSSGDAWGAARTAAEAAGVNLRPLDDLRDVGLVSSVIERVWGPEADFPPGVVRAFQHAGSVLLGAESDQEFVGFVFGFLGFGGGLHVHSHMLAVIPGEQDRGVGYALKLAQRAACLERGVEEVRWTFDPLVAKNARFNLVKLGAVARRYLPEFYGEMTDRLNRGDRSDRFEVRWMITSNRVDRAIRGELEPPTTETRRVPIPPDHHGMKETDPEGARRWRRAAGDAFAASFGAGLVATWLTTEPSYVFEPADAVDG